jgi:hypothetical protein
MQNENFQECLQAWTICIMNGITTMLIGKDSSKIKMEISPSSLKQSWTNFIKFGMFLVFSMEQMISTF